MIGSVYPRPYTKDETGARRPVKGSTWTYQFMVKRNGKRVTVSKGGYRTKTLAEKALAEAIAGYQPRASEPSKVTFGAFLTDEWLPVVERTRKPSTSYTYRHFVERRIVPGLGELRLCDLTPGDLVRFYASLRAGGRRDSNEGGLSERTIKQVHCVISAALRHALEDGLVTRNAAAAVPRDAKPRPARTTEMDTWTAHELHTFLASVRDDRLCSLFAFLAATGLRRSEAIALRWEDVDLAAGQVAVRRGLVAVGAEVHEGTPKSGKARTIAVDPEVVTLLKRHRTAQLEDRMRWGEAWTEPAGCSPARTGARSGPAA